MTRCDTQRTRTSRVVLLILASLVTLGLLLAATHAVWLPWVARLLIDGEAPTEADAILVLGGGSGDRLERAAQLYKDGYAPVMITSGESPTLPGVADSFAELAADYLVTLGVPEDAILMLPETTSTRDEATQSLVLAREAGISSLLVVTSEYHSRRSGLAFAAAYRGSDINVTLVTSCSDWWDASCWWRNELSLIAVAEEYIKGVYYFMHGYFFAR